MSRITTPNEFRDWALWTATAPRDYYSLLRNYREMHREHPPESLMLAIDARMAKVYP